MKRLVRNVAVIAAGAYVAWGLSRWLVQERRHGHRSEKHQMETWEGEGGNLPPHEQVKVAPQSV